MSAPVLEVSQVSKIFKDFWRRPKVTAVRDLSFTIKRGEVFGLLGPNGSGKSTTIKMILGLLYPSQGHIRLLDHSPREVKVKRRIGYLPEESYLYSYLTSEETLDFYGQLFDLDRHERRQRIDQLLEMIGLSHARHRRVGEFSKGMARRIGLAQALINDPDFILLDEPTSGLDPLGCRQVKDLILMLARRGKTILMTSHLLADVEDVCDRVAILYNGEAQAIGSLDELLVETSRYRFTMPADLSREQVESVAAQVEVVTGAKPHIDHTRRDLEQYFLQIVERARRQKKPDSGVAESGAVASYLAESGTGPAPAAEARSREQIDEELKKLVRPRPPT